MNGDWGMHWKVSEQSSGVLRQHLLHCDLVNVLRNIQSKAHCKAESLWPMLQTVQSEEYGGLHGDGEGFVLPRMPFFDVGHQLVEEVEVQAANAVAIWWS